MSEHTKEQEHPSVQFNSCPCTLRLHVFLEAVLGEDDEEEKLEG